MPAPQLLCAQWPYWTSRPLGHFLPKPSISLPSSSSYPCPRAPGGPRSQQTQGREVQAGEGFGQATAVAA